MLTEGLTPYQWLGFFAATGSGLFWTLTYALIIRRGARDRAVGMPTVALAANMSWELFFLVFTIREGHFDERLATLAPWVLLDFAIVYQCFKFGRDDVMHPLARRFYLPGLGLTFVLAGAVVTGTVLEFQDTLGWYVAFGQNLLMSGLFIQMILRRDSVEGQSIYIALAKFLGTLFAFFLALGWSPPSLHEVWKSMIPSSYTPVAPLIVVLYAGIFALDLIYIALIVHVSRRDGVSLWRRV